MTRTVQCCPSCESTQFQSRVHKRPKFRCTECGEEFADPETRESKQGDPRSGLAAKIRDDEVLSL